MSRSSEHQGREHAVACRGCGMSTRSGRVRPRTMTWNVSGLCDAHEAARDAEDAARLRLVTR